MAQRIDVHQHLLPPIYRDALRAAGITEAGGRPLPDWSSEHALDFMGGARITTGVLSVSTPGTTFLDDPDAAGTLARRINEYGAELVEQHPDRIGHFATLPMPDVDRSVTEAVHALDVLGADGVVLLAGWPPPAPPSRTGPCEHCSSSPTRRPAPVFAHGEGPFPTEPVPIQPPSSASTGVRRHLTDLGDVTMCQQEGVTRRQW